MRPVPENVQKKLKRDEERKKSEVAAKSERKKENIKRKSEYLSRAQKYQKLHQEAQMNLVKAKRDARAQGGIYVPAEAKVAFVVRIRGINKLHPDVKKIMRLLRLRQLHNGVFVKLNKATINMLRRVEPYITYGYLTRETVSKLIYKRGFGKVNKQRLPLTDNRIVEKVLKEQNIICVEDLINEIHNCGANFKQANNFLWPIKLQSPRGGFVAKRHSYLDGGDFGPREDRMNELVLRML